MCVNLWKVVKLKVPQLCLSDKYSTDYTFVNLKLWSAYDLTHTKVNLTTAIKYAVCTC